MTHPEICIPAHLAPAQQHKAARLARKERPDNAPGRAALNNLIAGGLNPPEAAVFLTSALWQEKRQIRISFLGEASGASSLQDAVRHYIEELYSHTNLTLKWMRDASAGEIRIAFERGGSWSYIGSQCLQISSGPTMNFGWLDGASSDSTIRSVVLHESGHSVGMGHAHKSPATPWQWDEEAVYRDLSGPPNNWSRETIRRNVIERYEAEDTKNSSFDPESIMAYAIPNSWTVGDYEVHRNTELSPTDIAWLEKMYPSGNVEEPGVTEHEAERQRLEHRKKEAELLGRAVNERIARRIKYIERKLLALGQRS